MFVNVYGGSCVAQHDRTTVPMRHFFESQGQQTDAAVGPLIEAHIRQLQGWRTLADLGL